MIYAIAMNDNKLSHQFSKSARFDFYNEQQEPVAVYKNPALDIEGCQGKQAIVHLFKKMQCDVVVVRKIGEKTLSRLLNAGFNIERGNTRHSTSELLTAAASQQSPLTDPAQGIKKSCEHSHEQHSCCGHH